MAAIQQPELHDYNCRPSQLSAFLSRIGFKRDDKRTAATASAAAVATANGYDRNISLAKLTSQNKTSHVTSDELCNLTASAGQQPEKFQKHEQHRRRRSVDGTKVKRRSSPFLRLVHRISMNRKQFVAANHNADPLNCTAPASMSPTLDQIDASPSSSVSTSTVETSPRPAWSENDLRHLNVRNIQTATNVNSPLSGTANTFSSENNLLLGSPDGISYKKHIPSYLRISCALNGYPALRCRHICDKQQQPSSSLLSTSTTAKTASTMPLGLVERRTLVFENKLENSVNPSEIPSEKSIKMMDAMVTRPTAVRRLVAQFDTIQIGDEAKNSDDDSMHEKSVDSAAGDSSDSQLSPVHSARLIEECRTLLSWTALENSIPLSGQTLEKALSQPTPEPELAHAIHNGLRESTVSHCQPNMKNLAEVVVSELQVTGPDVAMKICNEDSANFLSGEHFRKLLAVCRGTLQKRAKLASDILDNDPTVPETAADAIRLAVGKANLLLSRKMKTFGELIEKNLNPVTGDSQPAKVDDLSAYWDLVKMELSDVEHLFSDVDLLRQNKWQPLPESSEIATPMSTQKRSRERTSRKDQSTLTQKSKESQKSAAAEKQRRQALAEAKRKLRERMQQTDEGSTSFVM